MKQLTHIFLAMLICLVSDLAHARKVKVSVDEPEDYVNKTLPEAGTVWHCWYDGNDAVLCRLGESPADDDKALAEARPIDKRLPDVVRQIWQQAKQVAGRLVNIPLHTIPYDMALTGQLAESVMCSGATAPCGVIFAKNAVALAELVSLRNTQLAARSFGASLAMNSY